MLDLYAFPKDHESPYTNAIQTITNPHQKIIALEDAVALNIGHPRFIPYIQLHEFEAFLLVNVDRLITMYPDGATGIGRLKRDIKNLKPEEINESPHSAPSKRIIRHLPEYEGQKAQVGPLVAEDIGLTELRHKCPHFNEWMNKLEGLNTL